MQFRRLIEFKKQYKETRFEKRRQNTKISTTGGLEGVGGGWRGLGGKIIDQDVLFSIPEAKY